jgi:hypothetical protein
MQNKESIYNNHLMKNKYSSLLDMLLTPMLFVQNGKVFDNLTLKSELLDMKRL